MILEKKISFHLQKFSKIKILILSLGILFLALDGFLKIIVILQINFGLLNEFLTLLQIGIALTSQFVLPVTR